jgi:hypothetical protein
MAGSPADSFPPLDGNRRFSVQFGSCRQSAHLACKKQAKLASIEKWQGKSPSLGAAQDAR